MAGVDDEADGGDSVPEFPRSGSTVRGALFPEPVQVIIRTPLGTSVKLVGKGLDSNRVYEPILDVGQLAALVISPENHETDAWRAAIAIGAANQANELDQRFEIRPPAFGRIDGVPVDAQVAFEGWILGIR